MGEEPSSDGDQTERGPDGRFARGNGAGRGRPAGVRNRATVLLERLMIADGADVVRAVIKAAKDGDMTAAKLILDRLVPARRDRTVAVDLPEILTPAGAIAAQAELFKAVAAGELSPSEAAAVGSLIEGQRRLLELTEFEQRLAALEERAAGGRP